MENKGRFDESALKLESRSEANIETEASVSDLESKFLKICREYDAVRLDTYNSTEAEAQAKAVATQEQIAALNRLKENFLPIIYELQERVGIAQSHVVLMNWIVKRGGAGKYVDDWTEFGRKMSENAIYTLYESTVFALEQEGPERNPSPYEAIVSTIKLKEIATELTDVMRPYVTSVCQAGSASWGAYYMTRGQRLKDPLEINSFEQKNGKQISDLDMLVFTKGVGDIENSIKAMVDRSLLAKEDLARVHAFISLAQRGQAHIFSTYAHHKGVDQSFLFIPEFVVDRIIHPNNEGGIDAIKDFRPDKPKSFKEEGGYPLHNLQNELIAVHATEPVVVTDNGMELGYICERPSGGLIKRQDGTKEFTLGIIIRQLISHPYVLHDTDSFLNKKLVEYLKTMSEYFPKEGDLNMMRWERMPQSVRDRIEALIQQHAQGT